MLRRRPVRYIIMLQAVPNGLFRLDVNKIGQIVTDNNKPKDRPSSRSCPLSTLFSYADHLARHSTELAPRPVASPTGMRWSARGGEREGAGRHGRRQGRRDGESRERYCGPGGSHVGGGRAAAAAAASAVSGAAMAAETTTTSRLSAW